MASQADDDLAPTKTEGFKVGEKKTVEEYAKLDEGDESLRRWKESLGIGASSGAPLSNPDDSRRCVILSLGLEVEGRDDIIIDLTAPGAVEALKSKPFTIKEGAEFRMKARFRVQREVLSGLNYIQVAKRKGIRVSKDQEMIGSYPPNTETTPSYEKKFALDEAPSGMMVRGHYEAVSSFTDDDNVTHLKFEWSFDIAKNW
ncbi:MAG: hypothetical protein M4579_004940 [Chaenotheca gracillima]|nr:MAG: hypothetical protein M4579_004940 [Chaenotheca gracillima]